MILADTPWSARCARGPGGQPALEVYEAGRLTDIIVATPIAARILRGARRARSGRGMAAMAWGRLPADGHGVSVAFASRWPRRAAVAAQVCEVAGLAWLAISHGRFASVSAVDHGRREQLRLHSRPLW
jgi:hypothetical protein